jgi:hypothetical protein
MILKLTVYIFPSDFMRSGSLQDFGPPRTRSNGKVTKQSVTDGGRYYLQGTNESFEHFSPAQHTMSLLTTGESTGEAICECNPPLERQWSLHCVVQ